MEKQSKNVGRQYFGAISANFIMFAHGTIVGWLSPALPMLMSENTPLASGPMTNEQVSWLGSIACLGAVVGAFIFTYLISKIGCKRAMILITIPSTIFWLLIHFGTTYNHLLFARALSGVSGGGILTTIFLYVSEIANDDIRGQLGSFTYFSRNIGILLAYVLGAIVEFQYLPYIFVAVPIVYVIVFTYLPNTPQFHLKKQELEKAESSLHYYKGFTGKSFEYHVAFRVEFERLKAIANQNENDEKAGLKDFFKPKAITGLVIGIALALFSQTTGSFTFLTYAVVVFEKTGSEFDPYLSSIVMAALQIAGNACTTQLVDYLGRKMLMVASLIGSAVSLFALALYLYLQQYGCDMAVFMWVPVTSLSVNIFVASAGIISVTGVCTVENLPSNIRSPGLAICSIFLNIFAFWCAKLFPTLLEVIELEGCVLIFAVCSLSGAFFIAFFVKETKGQSMDVLRKISTWTSEA